jgi:outer membrane immunogenic protein
MASGPYVPPEMPVVVPPPVIDIYTFEGYYAGAAVGYAFGEVTANDDNGYNLDAPFDIEVDGLVASLYGGYNFHRSGGLVFGAELEGGYLDLSGDRQSPATAAAGAPRNDSLYSINGGPYAALTGRVGVAAKRTLFFAKGGVAVAGIEASFEDTDTTVLGGFIAPTSETVEVGYTVGAGVEHAIGDRTLLRLEAQYFDFGDVTVNSGNFGFTFEGIDAVVLKAGITMRF